MPKPVLELLLSVTRATVPTTTGLKIAAATATSMKAARKVGMVVACPSR